MAEAASILTATANEVKLAKSRGFWTGAAVTGLIVGFMAYQSGHTNGWNDALQCIRTIGSC